MRRYSHLREPHTRTSPTSTPVPDFSPSSWLMENPTLIKHARCRCRQEDHIHVYCQAECCTPFSIFGHGTNACSADSCRYRSSHRKVNCTSRSSCSEVTCSALPRMAPSRAAALTFIIWPAITVVSGSTNVEAVTTTSQGQMLRSLRSLRQRRSRPFHPVSLCIYPQLCSRHRGIALIPSPLHRNPTWRLLRVSFCIDVLH